MTDAPAPDEGAICPGCGWAVVYNAPTGCFNCGYEPPGPDPGGPGGSP